MKTLYIGNLDPAVTEELLAGIFAPFGHVVSYKIIHESANNTGLMNGSSGQSGDPYAFVEFADNVSANLALTSMNRRMCLGRELKVNWATSPGSSAGPKRDTSRDHHIFVGDLGPEIETHQLRDAFAPFGEISDCRVVKDQATQKSKGYGFVSFVKKHEAENAINTMNGQWLGSRAIRTNWATRKPSGAGAGVTGRVSSSLNGSVSGIHMSDGMNGHQSHQHSSNNKMLTFEDIYQQSSPTNCTVYCGGISSGLSEDLIRSHFSPYGVIHEVRVFKDKGYAFVKFANKESAAAAILNLNGSEVNGHIIKCSWGKEAGDPNHMSNITSMYSALAAAAAGYPYHAAPHPAAVNLGYWYPGGAAIANHPAAMYPGNPLAMAAAAAAQQQHQQHHHPHHSHQVNSHSAYGQQANSYGQYFAGGNSGGGSTGGWNHQQSHQQQSHGNSGHPQQHAAAAAGHSSHMSHGPGNNSQHHAGHPHPPQLAPAFLPTPAYHAQ